MTIIVWILEEMFFEISILEKGKVDKRGKWGGPDHFGF
jgi:hypothetical protein